MRSFASSRSRKIQANAQVDSDAPPVDLPKVEKRMVAVPNGLSTDSDVFKREADSMSRRNLCANAQKFEFQAEVSCGLWTLLSTLFTAIRIFS
ncbi:heat shock protein 90 [Orobanche gracilis]